MLIPIRAGELEVVLKSLGVELPPDSTLSFEDLLSMLLSQISSRDAVVDGEAPPNKGKQSHELVKDIGTGELPPQLLAFLGAMVSETQNPDSKGEKKPEQLLPTHLRVGIEPRRETLDNFLKGRYYTDAEGKPHIKAPLSTEAGVRGISSPERADQSKYAEVNSGTGTNRFSLAPVTDDTKALSDREGKTHKAREPVYSVGFKDTNLIRVASISKPETATNVSQGEIEAQVKVSKLIQSDTLEPKKNTGADRNFLHPGSSDIEREEPIQLSEPPVKDQQVKGKEHSVEFGTTGVDRNSGKKDSWAGTGAGTKALETQRESGAVFQSVGSQSEPQEEHTKAYELGRRESTYQPPYTRGETKQISLRFEDAQLRFRFQNEYMNVDLHTKESLQRQLTYLDVRRLSKNLESIGISLEGFRVNGSEMLTRSSRMTRKEERERFNIEGKDGANKKVLHSSSDSADFNLLL